jgi:hypothetical protein
MNGWLYLILFFIILFSYIHVQKQWKIVSSHEIFEYDYRSLKELQPVCEYKQPIVFSLDIPTYLEAFHINSLHICDLRDRTKENSYIELIHLPIDQAKGLMMTDTNSTYYSFRNNNTIKQSSQCTQWFRKLDSHLKPQFTVHEEYDVIYGSRKTRTIPQFNRESHTFIYVPPDNNRSFIRMKMISIKKLPELYYENDYVYYEFWSQVDLFAPEYDYKCAEILVKPGSTVFIPSYWFYSFEFQDKHNQICMVKYTTIPNLMANAKHLSMYYLQQQNIEEKWWKPLTSQAKSSIENEESSIHEILSEPSKNIHIVTKETKSTIQIENEKMRDREISDPQQYTPPIKDEITEIKSVVDSLIHDISTKR